ncbi:hypothetical protein ACMA1D_10645 [Streptomyces sp. 796.1]|uniref:hypothetical protein n=1 Tax=Streptomyces sp. 796.1 TaxID=3163029 RepID=UPI0039C9130D
MAWTAPMTAVAGATFSAQEYNLYIRDNLMTTAPAKATAAGQHFVTSGAREITARTTTGSSAAGTVTATTDIYTAKTGGPQVTVTTGSEALVWFAAELSNDTAQGQSSCSVAATGASNVPAHNNWRLINDGTPAGQPLRAMSFHRFTELNPGSNTFTMLYRAGTTSEIASFAERHLVVMPL